MDSPDAQNLQVWYRRESVESQARTCCSPPPGSLCVSEKAQASSMDQAPLPVTLARIMMPPMSRWWAAVPSFALNNGLCEGRLPLDALNASGARLLT
jgi:hypothetical protein